MSLVLASTSPFRAMLLKNAGLDFIANAPEIDERALEAPLTDSGATPADVAEILGGEGHRCVTASSRSAYCWRRSDPIAG